MAGSLVANLVLSKSLLRSQGGLTDVYVRVLRIESESSLIRNLNHVNAVHVRSAGRVRASNPAAPSHVWTSSKSTRLKPSANAARAASLANPRPQTTNTLVYPNGGGCWLPAYAASVVRHGRT